MKTAQKYVYLIHGWSGSAEGAFRPWLKIELEKEGYTVESLTMPDADHPRIELWIPYMQKVITSSPEKTILVGHSMGGQAVLRYLEALPEGKVIAKAILVASVVDQITNLSEEEKPIAEPWLTTPIDAEKVKRSVKEIVAFFSDNDQWIPLTSEKVMREKFGARTLIEHGKHHYGDDDGISEVPAVLGEIIKP